MELNPFQVSFAGGELSPLVVHRFDSEVYGIGARTLENFIVLATEGLARRPGTHHADDGSTKGNVPAYLVGWKYSTDDVYVLEFTPLFMRVYRNRALVLSGGVPLAVATPFTAAELPYLQVYQSGDVLWIQTGARATYRLTRTSHTSWTLTALSITDGPWLATNTGATTMTASATGSPGDSITITASANEFEDDHVGALLRLDATMPARSQAETFTGVADDAHSLLLAENAEWEFVVYGSGAANFQIDLQASFDNATWFQYRTVVGASEAGTNWRERLSGANDEGQAIYLRAACTDYTSGTVKTTLNAMPYVYEGVVRITAVTSATLATADIVVTPANTSATVDWAWNAFNDVEGWPQALGFITERLLMAGTDSNPLSIYAGVAGDYESFNAGEGNDSDAFSVTLSQSQQYRINWIRGDWRDSIVLGTEGSLVELVPLSGSGGFTPTNWPSVHRTLALRTSRIPPILTDDVLLVPGGLGDKKVYQVFFSNERGGLIAADLTEWASHICGTGFTGLILQREPHPILWLPRSDGYVAGCTIKPSKAGWHRHTFGEGVVSGCTIPTDDGDELWLCVERLVGGATTYFIEYMYKVDTEAEIQDAYHLDCGESWDGGEAVDVTTVVRADPVEIRLADWPQDSGGNNLADGHFVRFAGLNAELLDQVFKVYNCNSTAKTLSLKDETGTTVIDASLFDVYASGGTMEWVVKTVGGMDHLAGETLTALTDGVEQDVVPAGSGNVTLDDYYNTVAIGIPFTSRFVSLPPEFYLRSGTTVGKAKELSQLTISLYKSYGGKYGTGNGTLRDIPYTRTASQTGTVPVLFTGEKNLAAIGGVFKGELNAVIEADGAYPFTIRAIVPQIEVYT